MDFSVDAETRKRIEETRALGEREFRPAGIEADRRGAPIPVEDPFFERCLERGEGRTRWPGPNGRRPSGFAPKQSVITTLLLAEELAYWDRGVINATPGPGLPEEVIANTAAKYREAQERLTR